MVVKHSTKIVTIILVLISSYLTIVQFTSEITLFSASQKIALEGENHEGQKIAFKSERKIMEYIIRQRNNISRLLNLKQQKIGQMECEVCCSLILFTIHQMENFFDFFFFSFDAK